MSVESDLKKISDYNYLKNLQHSFGDAFYILHTDQFKQNYCELKSAFSSIYSNFNIAYSYKTNYVPRLCQIVNGLGGFAEVVSDMEIEIAKRSGVSANMIIFNGPFKKTSAVEELLLAGGTVNLDSIYELESIKIIHKTHPNSILNIGIRVNFDINDGVLSRFGFDVDRKEFMDVIKYITSTEGINFVGLHAHFASRSLKTWKPRAEEMLKLIDRLGINPEHIDIGGGLFGKMSDDFKAQFDSYIPTYSEYAEEVATVFAEHYKDTPEKQKPLLLIEPGSAIVGDCMSLVSKVQSIKFVRNKPIATILASMYNINMGKKNPPLRVVQKNGVIHHNYIDLNFAGFTCIESDYLYRGFTGLLAVGDYVILGNVGSYSIVFKPPFILPNFAVLEIEEGGGVDIIKKAEVFDDLFRTYKF